MVRYVGKIIVPHARERVFELMADWRNLKVWDLNIIKSDLANGFTDPKAGVGTEYKCQFKVGKQNPVDVDYKCSKYNAPENCEYKGLANLFKSTDRIQCTQLDDKQTEITAEFNLDFRGLLSPFSFVMNGTMQSTGPIIMKDIEDFVNSTLSKTEN